ncbi:hypothetical protein AAYQ05_09330 [Flavobacterium sp. B11]|uniref:hypothetical protein n=1 Tax=Flavobacterium movens TaxID=214860 RepID=UPI0031CE33A1
MTKLKLNWKEILFPVLEDIRIINKEVETTKVSSNNWALAETQNNAAYKKVINTIKESRSDDDNQHNIVIIK